MARKVSSKNNTVQQVNEFDLTNIKPNTNIAVIGKHSTGKNWCIKNLIHQIGNQSTTIISPTDTNFYETSFPNASIYYGCNTSIIGDIIYDQAVKNQQNKSKKVTVVIDGCLQSNDNNIKDLFMNGRHYNLTSIITMQYPLGINPELRCNLDYVFIFKDHFERNLKRIYAYYANVFPTYDAFKTVFLQITKGYNCMVIDLRKPDIASSIYYFNPTKCNSNIIQTPINKPVTESQINDSLISDYTTESIAKQIEPMLDNLFVVEPEINQSVELLNPEQNSSKTILVEEKVIDQTIIQDKLEQTLKTEQVDSNVETINVTNDNEVNTTKEPQSYYMYFKSFFI